MTLPGKTYDYGERQDDGRERDQYREHQPGSPSIFFLVVAVFQRNCSRTLSFKESTRRLARKSGVVKEMRPAPAFPRPKTESIRPGEPEGSTRL